VRCAIVMRVAATAALVCVFMALENVVGVGNVVFAGKCTSTST